MIDIKFLDKVYARLKEISDEILAFPSPDHSHYMKRVGQYQGLQEAANIMHGLLNTDDETQ